MEAKIILYDLEVSRAIVEGYGNRWEFKVIKVVRPQELMCYAWKELDSTKTHYVGRHDFPTYKAFVKSLADVLNEADISIAHNGIGFDDKMSNTFFIKMGVDVPKPRKSIDTLRVARNKFKFQSNSLNDLAEYLNLGSKEKITYADLETDFMTKSPTPRTLRLMKKYVKGDVTLLEKLYKVLRPFMTNHPNLATISNVPWSCPKCQSKHLQSRGYHRTTTATYHTYWCVDCHGWSRERIQDKTFEKPELVSV